MRETYERVRQLSSAVGDKMPLLPALFYLRTAFAQPAERQARLDFAERLIARAAETDPTLVCLAHWVLGLELTYLGEFERARSHLEYVVETHDSHSQQWLAFLYGHDIGVASRARLSWVLWFLGNPEEAERYSRMAIELARELGNQLVLGFAIGIAGVMFHQQRGEVQAVMAWHQQSRELSRVEGFTLFNEPEMFTHGWILAETGQLTEGISLMNQSLQVLRTSGTGRHRTFHLGLLASAYGKAGRVREALTTIDEALAEVEKNFERYYEAELYRLKGEVLQAIDAEAAEKCFIHAIDIARTQQARMWELRIMTSLCRLWKVQGKTKQARSALNALYREFTEGFETRDLQEAARLIQELAHHPIVSEP